MIFYKASAKTFDKKHNVKLRMTLKDQDRKHMKTEILNTVFHSKCFLKLIFRNMRFSKRQDYK